jgi:membrane protein
MARGVGRVLHLQYLANFKSFIVTYGSFAAAIILLVWLWLTNVALLVGAEVNAEIERAKESAEGRSQPETRNLPTRTLTRQLEQHPLRDHARTRA